MVAGDVGRKVKVERVGVSIVFLFVVEIVAVVGTGVVAFGACERWSAFFSVKESLSAAAGACDGALRSGRISAGRHPFEPFARQRRLLALETQSAIVDCEEDSRQM